MEKMVQIREEDLKTIIKIIKGFRATTNKIIENGGPIIFDVGETIKVSNYLTVTIDRLFSYLEK